MPKEKELTKPIANLYKKNAESLMLFAWVKGQKAIVPTVTLNQAIMSYFRYFNISVDEWYISDALTTYNRLQKDFFNEITEENC